MNKKWNLSPIYVPNNACGISDWIPPLDASYSSINTNSWFDTKIHKRPDPIPVHEYDSIVPIIPPIAKAKSSHSESSDHDSLVPATERGATRTKETAGIISRVSTSFILTHR